MTKIVMFAVMLSVLAILPIFGQDQTADIQTALMNPWVLFGLMLFGSILSMVKQWSQAKMDGSSVTVGTYLSHAMEVFTTLGANALAFFLLVDSGNLNFVSAVSIGYALNSLSDLNPAGGRSTSLK